MIEKLKSKISNNLPGLKSQLIAAPPFRANSFSESDIDQVYDLMIYDKKNSSNKINFVLLQEIGDPIVDQSVSSDIFRESFLFYNDLL